MNSHYLNTTTDNLDRLDKGWFYCYKIIVDIYLGLTVLGPIFLLVASFQALSNSTGDASTITFTFFMNAMMLHLLNYQLQAITKRDLKAAKDALLGFTFYFFLNLFYLIGMSLAVYGTLNTTFAIQYGVALGVFLVCILIGSVQVYLFLKRNKSDSYQHMNHVAP